MTKSDISLSLDADVTECGDVVTGEVSWGAGDRVARRVVVALRFSTSGAGLPPDIGGPSEVEFAGTASGRERFELAVPANGPISFEGRTISVAWQVEARLDHRAERDPVTTETLTVLPSGGLAVWARQTAGPPTEED